MLHTPQPARAQRRTRAAAAAGPAQRHWQAGIGASERGDWQAAEQSFVRACAQAPRDALMWLNLAHARDRLGALEGAADAVVRCLDCEPTHALARRLAVEVWARLLMQRGAVAPQLPGLPERLRRDAALLVGIGRQLCVARRTVDAVSALMAALVLSPARVDAHENLMFCMRDLGLKSEAAECAKTVLALDPGRLSVRMHMLFDQRGACDWSDIGDGVGALVDDLMALPADAAAPLAPFGLLSLETGPRAHRRAAEIAARAACAGVTPLVPRAPAQRRSGPLRLGFLSHDFRDHPVSQLLAETIEQLDRGRCSVTLYAHGPADSSAWRGRLQAAADAFVDFGEEPDGVIARRIHADEIDLLLELGGHTRGSRLGVLAWRPAPVQVSFLGYPGTTGAAGVDYLIGDAGVTPLEHADDYSEKLAQLPGCLLPASTHRPLPAPMSRAVADLPEDAFVMCAFNQAYKLLPQTFEVWCDVMRQVPNAVLWLKAPNDDVIVNLRRRARELGVAPERLVFTIAKIGFEDHFSRLALADVFVDNWPYNAHTTASDALWAGLPVLTLRGRTFASRVAASLLQGAGLDDFVCDDVGQYRDRLLALARKPARLAEARAWLKLHRLELPIFDSQTYADDLLALCERMHERRMRGLDPDHLPAVAVSSATAQAARPAAPESAPPMPLPAHAPTGATIAPMQLHIGGKQAKPGWKLLNIQPGPAVDFVGDVCDLSAFADASCELIYASHVLEHVAQQRVPDTLRGLRRLLVPGGRLMVSVPDLEVLAHTIITPHASLKMKFHAMRMMFGGQVDAHDFHYFGWTFDFMQQFLRNAGFAQVERVPEFGLFDDTSQLKPWGFPISLNVVATV